MSRRTSQPTPRWYPQRPDIIFLQEVTSDVYNSILGNPKVREAFLVTDAEDQTSFEGVPFANMTLLSSKRSAFDLELQKEDDGVERGEKFMLHQQIMSFLTMPYIDNVLICSHAQVLFLLQEITRDRIV